MQKVFVILEFYTMYEFAALSYEETNVFHVTSSYEYAEELIKVRKQNLIDTYREMGYNNENDWFDEFTKTKEDYDIIRFEKDDSDYEYLHKWRIVEESVIDK